LRILAVIPAFNEEKHILKCLESFANQTYKDILFVVVNDASTDGTLSIVQDFIQDRPDFKLVNLNHKSEHLPGAKVVRTFYAGLNSENWKEFDVIVKLDADIILPPDYFEIMIFHLSQNQKVGIIGGLVYIEKNGQWIYENISSKKHVRGPIKTYRSTCFEAIGGLRETLGWDNLDILLAQMHGWEIQTVENIWVKHLKPTAQVYKKSKAEKLGQYFYYIGLDKMLALISCTKASWKEKSLRNFFVSYCAFLKMEKENAQRNISPEEIAFIRKSRRNEIFKKLRL
jgi:glycosyltransferase involved in cell wall biosynthesis